MLSDWNISSHALVEASPDGIVVCDPDGKIALANHEAERIFGYGNGELLGESFEVLIPEHARVQHQHHVAGYARAPRVRTMAAKIEVVGLHRNGANVPVEISLSPVVRERGMLVIVGIRDVSERRLLEVEGQRIASYLAAAVESVQDAFLVYDEHDVLIMTNSAARAAIDRAGDRPLIGQTFEQILDASLAANVYNLGSELPETWRARRLAYRQDPQGVFDVALADGRIHRIVERKTTFRGTVTVISDVTDDIRHANELERARQLAEAGSAAKSEFLSAMSHELRTPLNAILGFAQLLERDRKSPLNPRQLERIQHVVRGADQLVHLIDDVLDLSRVTDGRLSVSMEPVECRDVFDETRRTLQPVAARKQIDVVFADDLEIYPRVFADRSRLVQVLMNLGSNAIKFGRPGGRVELALEIVDDRARFIVRDDGPGIPVEQRHKLFEPFHRAGGATEGTGIGLAISRKIVELMHGTIGFVPRETGGAEFWVSLSVYARRMRDTVPDVLEARTSLVGVAITIVYIEDNPVNVSLMRDALGEMSSIELVAVHTAELGIELVRSRLPALVIMDINLPGMSGIEAARRLRENPETAQIPIIALSAANHARDAHHTKRAGFSAYLTKPLKLPELYAALDEVLHVPAVR
ncbi:MAG: PAS domain S-box protein [Kofleriaceae bacterium]